MTGLPRYVTKYSVVKSSASTNAFTVAGSVIVGPNMGRHIVAKAPTKDEAHAEFLRLAEDAYNSRQVGG